MSSRLDELNPAQREAVTHGEGPLLVLAGAGSGKTRVLTHRIAHLLAEGLARSHEVTAVTFTNKAAGEMRERVSELLGSPPSGAFVGTFHRWALELLRAYPREVGLPPRFAILDADDQRVMMARTLEDLGFDTKDLSPRAALARVSREVNQLQRPADLEGGSREDLARLWARYDERKREASAVDFDDMLVLALDLLRGSEEIRVRVQRRARFLLVDEFQDTNRLQLALLKHALDASINLTAVGDDDQSIYRWRGAEMDNILSFEKHFPGARVVKLEENYRSTQPILDAAGELIARNVGRRGKRLFTSRAGGEPVRLYVGEDDRAEARWVADRIEEKARDHGLGEVAVLTRTNAQSRPFEEELTRRRIAYRVIGGLRFWQRAEVKDAIAYLRLAVRPEDAVAFRRVVNVPARGIGAVTVERVERHAQTTGLGLVAAARELPEGLTARARTALESFFSLIDEAGQRHRDGDTGELAEWVVSASGLLAQYEGDAEDKVVRRENLAQLVSAAAEANALGQSLEELLDSVALLEEGEDAAHGEAVSLMTLHAAKGLEFEVVFLAGLEDNLLPHANSRNEHEALEEERRLAYVGMTRARRWLALTAARSRYLFGQRQRSTPSPFLVELPEDAYVDVSDEPVLGAAGRGHEPVGERRATPAAKAAPASARGSRRVRPTVTDASGTGWRPGDRVRHRRFGSGVVLACQGRGEHLKLVVFFDRAGRKTLVPSIAKLEKT